MLGSRVFFEVVQRLDGYERISIGPGELGDFDVADWQFTWEPSGGTLRVLNRAVVADDQAFALYCVYRVFATLVATVRRLVFTSRSSHLTAEHASFSASDAARITGQSESDPMTMPTCGR